MNMLSTITASQPTTYQAAIATAARRAAHSYFDQHILTDAERGYITIDEGDYGALPDHIVERIVMTVPGVLTDEY